MGWLVGRYKEEKEASKSENVELTGEGKEEIKWRGDTQEIERHPQVPYCTTEPSSHCYTSPSFPRVQAARGREGWKSEGSEVDKERLAGKWEKRGGG